MQLLKSLLVVTILVNSVAMAHAQTQELLSVDWGVRAKPSVVERRFDKAAIAEFFNYFWNDPEDIVQAEQIGDFRWIDVDKAWSI